MHPNEDTPSSELSLEPMDTRESATSAFKSHPNSRTTADRRVVSGAPRGAAFRGRSPLREDPPSAFLVGRPSSADRAAGASRFLSKENSRPADVGAFDAARSNCAPIML